MNRKVLWGCLGTFVLVLAGGSALIYFKFVKPIAAIVQDLEKITELQAMNTQIQNQNTYEPAEGQAVTVEQAERFQRVQTAMGNDMGKVVADLRGRTGTIEWMINEEKDDGPGFREALDAIEGLGALLPAAKEAQVQALNAEGFSLEEYRWVREQIYWALGQPDPTLYLEDVAKEIAESSRKSGSVNIDFEPGRRPDLPDATIAVASAYADSMQAWSVYRLFGL